MIDPDDHDCADPDLVSLYRAAARETPSPHLDRAVLAAAASEVRRRRHLPWAALAATLVLAVLLAPLLRDRLAPDYDHRAADRYLMQVEAPTASAAEVDAYLLQLPPLRTDS